jgi:hypothetical protein
MLDPLTSHRGSAAPKPSEPVCGRNSALRLAAETRAHAALSLSVEQEIDATQWRDGFWSRPDTLRERRAGTRPPAGTRPQQISDGIDREHRWGLQWMDGAMCYTLKSLRLGELMQAAATRRPRTNSIALRRVTVAPECF